MPKQIEGVSAAPKKLTRSISVGNNSNTPDDGREYVNEQKEQQRMIQ